MEEIFIYSLYFSGILVHIIFNLSQCLSSNNLNQICFYLFRISYSFIQIATLYLYPIWVKNFIIFYAFALFIHYLKIHSQKVFKSLNANLPFNFYYHLNYLSVQLLEQSHCLDFFNLNPHSILILSFYECFNLFFLNNSFCLTLFCILFICCHLNTIELYNLKLYLALQLILSVKVLAPLAYQIFNPTLINHHLMAKYLAHFLTFT